MDSAMISKIMKAKQYAAERDRLQFTSFTVVFTGDHKNHTISYQDGTFHCDCSFFEQRSVCSHTMAMERVLEGMLPAPAEPEPQAA